ncbi:MAG TPA: phosphate acyltransferase PlsX [Bacteroidota bacterium]|nr:phosphate acyltransferase PlsX [Bacteroidota bacterium]
MKNQPKRTRIVVDAMGGDFAPGNILAGACEALREAGDRLEISFAGPKDVIEHGMASVNHEGLTYGILHAPEVIGMNDGATAAVKQKKDSSIALGISAQPAGRADAFVSAGHTGAVMSASTLILGRLPGISRPTIGAFFPTETGVALLVDAGANVDCKAQHLLEFGIMGSIYAHSMFDIARPSVGLLSIGEEPSKGNAVSLEAYDLLAKSRLNFIGNIEGRDILKAKANVVVCDGFVGNIVLKFAESVLDLLRSKFRAYAARDLVRKIRVGLMYGTLKNILKDFDYQEHGGVPLLGVNGISIIGHGKSTPKAVKNMILKADEMARKNINQRIKESLVNQQ